jgi:dTDP-D-glucose 4,6-dehydratase
MKKQLRNKNIQNSSINLNSSRWFKLMEYYFLAGEKGEDLDFIIYITDRACYNLRYSVDSSKVQKVLVWESDQQFEEGIIIL